MTTPEWIAQVQIMFPGDTFCCEGADYSAALADAQRLGDRLAAKVGHGATANVSIVRQIGEPWVRTFMQSPWYDLHGTGDVICLKRSLGNAFTKDDVELLKQRLESFGLKVVDHWNGAGCDQVSFRCEGRDYEGPMPEDQTKALLAPREP